MEWSWKMDGRVARRCKENGYEKGEVNACPPRKEDEIRSAFYTLVCNLRINGHDRSTIITLHGSYDFRENGL